MKRSLILLSLLIASGAAAAQVQPQRAPEVLPMGKGDQVTVTPTKAAWR